MVEQEGAETGGREICGSPDRAGAAGAWSIRRRHPSHTRASIHQFHRIVSTSRIPCLPSTRHHLRHRTHTYHVTYSERRITIVTGQGAESDRVDTIQKKAWGRSG